MWPFKTCKHVWEITQVKQITYHSSEFTWVSRVCVNCLRDESHRVNGHIIYEKAEKIFKGDKKC